MSYQTGLEVFLRGKYQLIEGKRVGLVTNHTGLTTDLRNNIDLFYQHPGIDLVCLYGPEHGVRGNAQAGLKVVDSLDSCTGLSICSLYGDNRKPTSEMLEGIDVLVFDIQDIGVRFYTYISTLLYCLESAAENDLPLIVLDRLNPLGRRVEGNIVEQGFKSFIGLYPIPQRHGMTVGELANWANEEYNLGAELVVIKAEGWQGEYFDEMNLLWVPPSPNIPQFQTALVYPVTCLFEGTNISEGRGTANPFEFIGAPWVDPYRLSKHLAESFLPGVKFRPIYFVPSTSKHEGKECGGVQVIIEDRKKIDSHLTGLTLVKAFFDLYPGKSKWVTPKNKNNRYMFDLNMGTDKVRKELEAGRAPVEIISQWREEREEFSSVRENYLLY